MDLGLTGRRAAVTGGTRGIGRAIAEALAAEGADVAVCARGADGVEEIHLAAPLARELAADGVRVNAVSPGSILVDGGGWADVRDRDPAGFAAWLERDLPAGRLGAPHEVADVVCFLLSDRAAWVNGAHVAVDGAQGAPGMRGW